MLRRTLRRFDSELMLYAGEATEADLGFYRKLLATDKDKPLVRKRVSSVTSLKTRDPETRQALALAAGNLTRKALKRDAEEGPAADWRRKKTNWSMMRWECSESEVIRTRVLDIDDIEMEEMHHMFMHTLTRRMAAEKAIKVIGRLGVYRDKQNTHSLQNLMTDVTTVFGPYHGPELEALWSRCYGTIGVPFMLDYVRRFGRFSRHFLAKQIDRSNNPHFFDFCRYPSGRRPLPPILTHPYELWSWLRLLPKCSAKRYLVQRLLAEKIRSPDVNFLGDSARIERALSVSERAAEQLLIKPQSPAMRSRNPHVPRPDIQHFIQAEKTAETMTLSMTADTFDLQSIPVHPFGQAADSMALKPVHGDSDNSTTLVRLQKPQSHWWSHRKDRKFLYRGRQYKLTEGTGWKRVYRPVVDYGRDHRALLRLRRKDRMTQKKIHFKELYKRALHVDQ